MLITHEPLLNRQRAIASTRLILHGDDGNASCRDDIGAMNALEGAWPVRRPLIVSFGKRLSCIDILGWNMPANVMIEIPADDLDTPEARELLRNLEDKGIPVSVSGYAPQTRLPDGAQFRFLFTEQHGQPAPSNAPGLMIASNPRDHAEFETSLRNGYDGAAGWFFLRSAAPLAGKMAPGYARIVRLLNLVRNDADIREVEAALKQDVALSFKLLRYINSVGFGLSCEIQSFRHAVTILGYAKLNRWLSLLLTTASKDPCAPGLLQASATRGRFMELAGGEFFGKADLDNLFITGAFSLLDVMLGASMEVVLDQMHLPETINDALFRGEGVYAPFLRLARACEQRQAHDIAAAAEALQLPPDVVNRAQMSAIAFADDISLN